MRVVPRRSTLPCLGFLSLFAACSVSGPDDHDPLAGLGDARARWLASGISDYELALSRTCGECPPAAALAVVVSVAAREKTVSLAENGEPVEAPPQLYPDVDGLFALIEQSVLAGAEIDVEYDDELGYPRRVSVDPLPDAVDDEFGYLIDDLVVARLASLRAEVRLQRERWTARRIEDYQLTIRRSCFCAPEAAGLVVLTVLEGEPVEWLYFLSGDPIPLEWQFAFPAVEDLFDFLEDAIDRGAESIEVTFDPELGLPTSVVVDYRLGVADEEIAYVIEKIVRIETGEPPSTGRGLEAVLPPRS